MPDTPKPTAATAIRTDIEVASLVRRALVASADELVDALARSSRPTGAGNGPSTAGSPASPTSCAATTSCSTSMVVPALAARGALDQRSLDTLAADHAWIDQLLSDLGDALGILSFGLGAEAWWIGKASDLAVALHHVLAGPAEPGGAPAHAAVARWFDAAERDVLQREAMRAVATGPVRFSLAWLYTHLDDAERAAVAGFVPAASRLSWRSRRTSYTRSAVVALG